MLTRLFIVLAVCVLVVGGHAAKADAIYNLNYDGCSGGCGNNGQGSSNNSLGYVDLHQVNATQITVTLNLTAPNYFVNTGSGSNHAPFSFNTDTGVAISGLTDQTGSPSTFFTVGTSNASISGLGSFAYSIACTSNCPNGASNGGAGNLLSFTVTATSGVLSLSDFTANSSGYFFAADIIGPAGRTGEVAANQAPTTSGGGTTVPEPTSLALVGSSLMALGLARFLRRPFKFP